MPNHGNKEHIEKVLAALEGLLEGKATSDVANYSIAGRSLSRMPISELLVWRDKYRAELIKLERSAGLNKTGNIQVRF